MEISKLSRRSDIEQNKRFSGLYTQVGRIITDLEDRNVPAQLVPRINQLIDEVNAMAGSNKEWAKALRKAQNNLVTLLEKEMKLVPKNHYQNKWMPLGMAAFGIPFGVAFGTALDNMAFLGIGLPIGIGVGVAIGASLDKKAKDEGRQIDVVLKY